MSLKDAIQSLLRSRLSAYDPSLDTSEGSPIDTEVVQPVIARLGTFPLDTDVRAFIKARINENFSNIYTDGELEDLFINPLETILEPIILEESSVQINQSLVNADTMADEELDDNVANYFVERRDGGFSTGFARAYYNSPTQLVITTDNQVQSKSGLNFFPSANFEISSAQMLANREGFLFFVDIPLIAENAGSNYNIAANEIVSIDGLKSPIKITNLSKFSGGEDRESNQDLVIRAENSRTEQSLNTKRGAIARTMDIFSGIKTMQVVGAGEFGMERDILMGSSEGLVYRAVKGGTFGNWVYLDNSLRYKNPNFSVEIGDKLKFNVDVIGDLHEALIEKIIFVSGELMFLQLDRSFPTLYGQLLDGVLVKPGAITVSKVPEGTFSATVPSDKIHLYGYSDIYVAPFSTEDNFATINNLFDSNSFFRTETGQVSAGDNLFNTSPITDFITLGVLEGDVLTLETGTNAGTFKILSVTTSGLRVNSTFTNTETAIRSKIHRGLTVNYIAPRTTILPFYGSISDLTLTIGSPIFITTTNTQTYGAQVGDTIEVLSGQNKGIYKIIAFDLGLGGFGPIVDRNATASDSFVSYTIYREQAGIVPSFTRVKNIEILDTNSQSTGFFVPYGDFVDVRAKCDFEGIERIETVLDKKLFFLPSIAGVTLTNTPATPGAGVDARYTQKLESYDGTLKTVSCLGSNPIQTVEINIPPFIADSLNLVAADNPPKHSVMALVSKKDLHFLTDPFGNPLTSPLAEAKREDVLTVINNLNEDNYLIKDLRVLSLWGKSNNGHYAVALAEIEGEFKYDPVTSFISMINHGILLGSGLPFLSESEYMLIYEYATDFFNPSGFLEAILIPRVKATFDFLGFSINLNDVRNFVVNACVSQYSIGTAPRGELRCYTKEPVTVALYTEPTITKNNDLLSTTEFKELLPFGSTLKPKRVRIISDVSSGQIYPQSSEDQQVSFWARNASQKYPASTSLYLTDGDSFVKRGVKEGDTLEFYPQINDYSSRGLQVSSYLGITNSGSNIVQFIWPSSRNNSTAIQSGQVLAIDSGSDKGIYKIIEVVSDSYPTYKVKVDKILTNTTSSYPASVVFTGTCIGGTLVINDISLPGILNTGDWITIYAATSTTILTAGEDKAYIGSYEVTGVSPGSATLNRTDPFPANANILWIHHKAPLNTPSPTTGGGTEISENFIRIRLYSNTLEQRNIDINWAASPSPLDSASKDQIILDNSLTSPGSIVNFSHMSPFRIKRKGVKIISSTEMKEFYDRGLYYIDIPVIALGSSKDFYFKKGSVFSISGAYDIEGYKIIPDNFALTFSTKETGNILFPSSILPSGSTYSESNYISLSGQNIKINYESVSLINSIQQFYDSPLDRVIDSNMLAKSFLPAYVYLTVNYTGGRDTDVMAQAIISYISNIPADTNIISVDEIIEILKKNLAFSVENPIEIVSVVHGNDRKLVTLRSENNIGFTSPNTYRGIQKMIFFFPGKDLSKETVIPEGIEYIKLIRS